MARVWVKVAAHRGWTIAGRRAVRRGAFVADGYGPGVPIGHFDAAAFCTLPVHGPLARERAIRLARAAIDGRIAREEGEEVAAC